MADLDFSSRVLTQTVNQVKPVGNFILKTFFPTDDFSDTKYVDVVIKKGGRKVAPFVSPKLAGKVMKRDGKVLKTYEPPLMKPKFITDAEELLNTDTVFYADGTDPEDRANLRLAEDLADGKDRIHRGKELMAVESLISGKITVKGDGVEDEIDFGRAAENTKILTGTALWTATESDPITSLKTWAEYLFEKTGIAPDKVVFGRDVGNAFTSHEKVIKAFDVKRIDNGELNPEKLEDGVVFIGYLKELNLKIYKYVDYYENEAGVSTLIMPGDKLILGSDRAGGKVAHGGIVDFKAFKAAGMDTNIFVGDIFAKSYEENDPSVRFLVLQSKPLPLPGDVDSYLSAKVV
jgi:hypothetical protein